MNFISVSSFRFLVFIAQFSLVAFSGLGSYTSSSFSRSIGYILRGFLLGEMEVPDIMECKRRCILSANCVSVNILPTADQRFLCQLNSGRMEDAVEGQFVPQGAGEYYGLKVNVTKYI